MNAHRTEPRCRNRTFRYLRVLAIVSCGIYALLTALSLRFRYDLPLQDRPIGLVLICLALVFGIYLLALRLALQATSGSKLLWHLVLPAIIFRAVLLFSVPIQEIDIYRYVWDGLVSTQGVSPYRYSPDQVRRAEVGPSLPEDLASLVALCDESRSVATVLSRVHYGELPTIYPPTSQLVFAGVAALTPNGATVPSRLMVMKGVVVVFDLITFGLLIAILKTTGRHVGWSLAYAWCPLVLKEFANSGHLDAIAVMFSMAAVLLAVRVRRSEALQNSWYPLRMMTAATGMFVLAVGAKLYPVVLAPWLGAMCWKSLGWRRTSVVALVGGVGSILILAPIWPKAGETAGSEMASSALVDGPPPPPPSPLDTRPQNPSRGLSTFFRRWEMNDFLFMLTVENLRPLEPGSGKTATPWFSVAPDSWRRFLIVPLGAALGLDSRETAFHATRGLMAAIFLVIATAMAVRTWRSPSPDAWLESAFLTLAWFWLMCPTQNPWYWIWALPLVAFARNRCWLLLSGLVLLYYGRFWFEYQFYDQPVWGTAYVGSIFFDYVVTWIEFAPWLAVLAFTGWRRASTCVTLMPSQPSIPVASNHKTTSLESWSSEVVGSRSGS